MTLYAFLESGKFGDAARGIEPFLGVRKSWLKVKECTVDGIRAHGARMPEEQRGAWRSLGAAEPGVLLSRGQG